MSKQALYSTSGKLLYETDAENLSKCLEKAVKEKASLVGLDLRNKTISDVDLSNAMFNSVDFSNATFENVKMKGADFKRFEKLDDWILGSDTDISKAVFKNVDLSEAEFYKTDAKEASFINTNLEDADLKWSNFAGAKFKECNVSGAIFDDVKLKQAGDLFSKKAKFENVEFSSLEQASMLEQKGAKVKKPTVKETDPRFSALVNLAKKAKQR